MSDQAQRAEHDNIDDVTVEEHHEPFVDADDTRTEESHDQLDEIRVELNRLGDNLAKVASEAAYATVGLVGLVSDRVKELYAEQKAQYAAEHPDFEGEPDARHVLSRVGEQVDRFVGDVSSAIHDLAERGRATAKPSETAQNDEGAEDAEIVDLDARFDAEESSEGETGGTGS